jgi:Family of unknown function (DUF5519)
MAHPELLDEIANELDTWPGVHIERRSPSITVVRYEQLELGILDRDQGLVELRFSPAERDELVEHGGGEPAAPIIEAETVAHDVRGPADVSAALALFDRRYRDLRGEDDPFSSQDPGF